MAAWNSLILGSGSMEFINIGEVEEGVTAWNSLILGRREWQHGIH